MERALGPRPSVHLPSVCGTTRRRGLGLSSPSGPVRSPGLTYPQDLLLLLLLLPDMVLLLLLLLVRLLRLRLRLRLLLWPRTRSFVSTLSCSGRPPRALPCFVFVAGPTTDALLAAQLGVQPRLPLSLSSWPAALVRTEKVGRGQLAEATEIAAHDSHRSSRKVGTQDPTVC